MAKKSVKHRDAMRRKLVNKLRTVRDQLRSDCCDVNLSDNERLEAQEKFHALPRNSSPVRRRNRCKLCGRPRGYNRLTGLCRLHMRIAMLSGMIPGMLKSSW